MRLGARRAAQSGNGGIIFFLDSAGRILHNDICCALCGLALEGREAYQQKSSGNNNFDFFGQYNLLATLQLDYPSDGHWYVVGTPS